MILRRIVLIFVSAILIFGVQAQNGSVALRKTDYTLWWSGSTFKATLNEIPVRDNPDIQVSAAGREFEPLQLVVNPARRLDNFRISVSPLTGENGNLISNDNIKIYDEVFVNVTKPTDSQSRPGWYPDPLLPDQGPMTLYPKQNYPFWMDIFIPEGTKAGIFKGVVSFSYGAVTDKIPFTVKVWNFSLPKVPSMRSSFGVGPEMIRKYHHLTNDAELRSVYDKYLRKLHDFRLNPTSPFELNPMKVAITGVGWENGLFDSENAKQGKYCYKIEDDDLTKNITAKTDHRIPVAPAISYTLNWQAKCGADKSNYAVGIRFYNAEGEQLVYENILNTYAGGKEWKANTLKFSDLNTEIRSAEIILYGAFPNENGTTTGTVFFDEMSLKSAGEELLENGDFEVSLDKIGVSVDFEDFDKAAHRYLDEFGFNAFNLHLQGMGSGTYYSQKYGRFAGFHQHTPEYGQLMKSYLSQIENHLARNGWLGKEYIYWFDEPNPENYPFVREGMDVLKQGAPKLKRFITEDAPGEAIMDLTDISCTIWHKIDTVKVAKMVASGKEYWSYLCCWPKSPWVSEFIDHPAINLRIWSWMSFRWKLSGILMWETTYWNSDLLNDNGKLQNPWKEPMSFVTGYGEPYGKPIFWGNGDGRYFYPPRDFEDGKKRLDDEPIASIRLSLVREGVEDYDYFIILQNLVKELSPLKHRDLIAKASELLTFDQGMFSGLDKYTKDSEVLTQRRNQIAGLIEQIELLTK